MNKFDIEDKLNQGYEEKSALKQIVEEPPLRNLNTGGLVKYKKELKELVDCINTVPQSHGIPIEVNITEENNNWKTTLAAT